MYIHSHGLAFQSVCSSNETCHVMTSKSSTHMQTEDSEQNKRWHQELMWHDIHHQHKEMHYIVDVLYVYECCAL